MNACVIAYSFYDVDYRIRRYAEALVECGNTVDAIALRGKGEKRYDVLNGVRVYRGKDHASTTLHDPHRQRHL